MRLVGAALALLLLVHGGASGAAGPVAPTPPSAREPNKRTLMFWLIDSNKLTPKPTKGNPRPKPVPDTDAIWEERIATVKAHRENVTGISPCIYSFSSSGEFVPSKADAAVGKWVPKYAALGLDVVPLIDAAGGLGGLDSLLKSADKFISSAVATAVKNNYSGYNFDNELRGSTSDKSWEGLEKYAAGWMEFLNKFADALHAKGKTLSVDIAGCCGWVDPKHPLAPAGHCAGAFSTHEFVATTCAQYKQSKLDIVYGMSTYTGNLNGPPFNDTKDSNTYDGPGLTRLIANVTQSGVGREKYGIGFKGGWPDCVGSTAGTPGCAPVFDETAKATIRYITGTLGVVHSSEWVNEPRSQAQWDAWGYWLHGDM